jgi:hypothetical protein
VLFKMVNQLQSLLLDEPCQQVGGPGGSLLPAQSPAQMWRQ